MKRDYLNGTPYEIEQGEQMYHFNSDTELLGKFMKIHKGDSVLDIGTNNGALLFFAKTKKAGSLCGIDLFEEVLALAEKNFAYYEIPVELHQCPLQEFHHVPFDVIICNPPYFSTKSEELKNENQYIRAARHEENLNLDTLFSCTAELLKDNGHFYMVHRPDRIFEIISTARDYGMVPVRIRIAYASQKKQAKSILMEFQKGTKKDQVIEAPIFLNDRTTFD